MTRKSYTSINRCSRSAISAAALLLSCLTTTAYGEKTKDAENDAAQANNPLADIRAFNLHNYYVPELSPPVDETANSFILPLVLNSFLYFSSNFLAKKSAISESILSPPR